MNPIRSLPLLFAIAFLASCCDIPSQPDTQAIVTKIPDQITARDIQQKTNDVRAKSSDNAIKALKLFLSKRITETERKRFAKGNATILLMLNESDWNRGFNRLSWADKLTKDSEKMVNDMATCLASVEVGHKRCIEEKIK